MFQESQLLAPINDDWGSFLISLPFPALDVSNGLKIMFLKSRLKN